MNWSEFTPSAPVCALGHLPQRWRQGRAARCAAPTPDGRARSNREEFAPLWDVLIHFLEIVGWCAQRGRYRPLDKESRPPRGKVCGRPQAALHQPMGTHGTRGGWDRFLTAAKGPGKLPEPFVCVCCKGEGEMGDINSFWVRYYPNR